MNDPVQLIMVAGAAGALFYVLRLIVDGKLHSDSEVQGLKQDKVDLLEINKKQNDALDAANKQLAVALAVLKEYSEWYSEDPTRRLE